MSKSTYFGVSLVDGKPTVTDERSKRASALALATGEKPHAFKAESGSAALEMYEREVVNAPEGSTADKIGDVQASVRDSAKSRRDANPQPRRGRSFFGVAMRGDKVLVSEAGSTTIERALSEAGSLGGRKDSEFVVEAANAEQVHVIVTALGEDERTGVIRQAAMPVLGPTLGEDGVLHAHDGSVAEERFAKRTVPVLPEDGTNYWVVPSGTIHSRSTCGFIKKGDVKSLPAEIDGENAVARSLRGEVLEADGGRKAKWWCRFCAVTEAEVVQPAESDDATSDPAEEQEKAAATA